MGRRNPQRKKALAYDSDDDDSVSSSSTAQTDGTLAKEIQDIQISDESLLDQAVDNLHEKRGATREKALAVIVELFRKNLQHEFVEKNFLTLLNRCLNSIKRGSSKEKILACNAIGMLALTTGCGDNAHEILEESLPVYAHALKSPSEASVALLESLAIITFVGGDDPEETEKAMQIMWQLVHPKLGSNVVGRKPPAAVIKSMVSSWALLLTTIDKWAMSSKDWKGSMSYLSALLDKDDQLVRIAAGEALALIFEMGNLEKFCVEAEGSREDPNSVGKLSNIQALKGSFLSTIRELSMEGGGKGASKKDLKSQRTRFREILDFLEDGTCPEIVIRIHNDGFATSTWQKLIQVDFLKHFLGGGFSKHMMDNELLHDVFGFAPQKPGHKKVIHAGLSAVNKGRTLRLNDARKARETENENWWGPSEK